MAMGYDMVVLIVFGSILGLGVLFLLGLIGKESFRGGKRRTKYLK